MQVFPQTIYQHPHHLRQWQPFHLLSSKIIGVIFYSSLFLTSVSYQEVLLTVASHYIWNMTTFHHLYDYYNFPTWITDLTSSTIAL